MKKTLMLVAMAVLLSQSAFSISIGVSPGRLDFNDVLRGGYAEKSVIISTNSPEQLVASIKVDGDIKEFISLSPKGDEFVMSQLEPYRLKIILRPPTDLRNETYSGTITFMTESFGNLSTRAGGMIRTAVSMQLNLKITGLQQAFCSAQGITVSDAEIGEAIKITARVSNGGNVRLRPEYRITIKDQKKTRTLQTRTIIGDEVLPTAEQFQTVSLNNQLPVGQYFSEIIIIPCEASRQTSFDIYEKGTISDKGELTGIKNPVWAFVNDSIPITVGFRNLGDRPISARFKGGIYRDEKFIRQLESSELIVLPGQNVDFDLFFMPAEPGRYIITGEVIYNKKTTYEKSSVVSVNPRQEEEQKGISLFPLLIYIAIIGIILFLIRMIRKKRKRH